MIKIFWFTLWVGTIIFLISYMKIRNRIPISKRDNIEKILMILILFFLVVNCFLLIKERRNTSMEMNDCIRFYQTFPMFYNDSEFYFVNEWCYKYFTPDEIIKIRRSTSRKYDSDSGLEDFLDSLKLNYTGGEK